MKPTDKQIECAARIAEREGCELPRENTKEAYWEFIHDRMKKKKERKYTREEVERVMIGACEDGRRGYCPYDLIIEDYVR